MEHYGLNKLYKEIENWDETQNLKDVSEVEIIREILDYVKRINEKEYYLIPQPDAVRERCDLDRFSMKILDEHNGDLSRFSEKFREAFVKTYGYMKPQPINNNKERKGL